MTHPKTSAVLMATGEMLNSACPAVGTCGDYQLVPNEEIAALRAEYDAWVAAGRPDLGGQGPHIPPIPAWAEYEVCMGCHKPTENVPAVYLPALKGRDCGCPCGTAMRLRKPSTPPAAAQDVEMPEPCKHWMPDDGPADVLLGGECRLIEEYERLKASQPTAPSSQRGTKCDKHNWRYGLCHECPYCEIERLEGEPAARPARVVEGVVQEYDSMTGRRFEGPSSWVATATPLRAGTPVQVVIPGEVDDEK